MKIVNRIIAICLFILVSSGADAKDAAGNNVTPQRVEEFVHEARNKALELINSSSEEEGLKRFFEMISNKSHFQDGELYLYVYDYTGKVLAHGAKKHLVGKQLINVKDKNGKHLIAALIYAANENRKKGNPPPNLESKLDLDKSVTSKYSAADYLKELELKRGEGWIEYVWQHPQVKKMQPKLGYVVPLTNKVWFGSGIYPLDNK